ncbi:thiosulfate sulfurtransferase TUM1 [Apiospora phragmitis]|uniref:Sulfurtransferase n=1 Tax=Apiospora phragmitis TaxID=2905665 RepID=A0ABR1X729_9PEZI
MASKTLQTLSTQTLLRASSRASTRPTAAAAAAAAAVRCIASSSTSRLYSSSPRAVHTSNTRTQLLPSRRPNRFLSGSMRWSSESATGSKIWTFEEIQSLPSTKPKTVTLIDVREPSELASTGRVPGAVNIPITTSPDSFHISEEEFAGRFGFARPDPQEDEVVFYCKAGVRSRAAAGIAREAGWRKVGEYPGSWVEWSGKGGQIEW